MCSYTDESGFDGVVPAHPIECEGPVRIKTMTLGEIAQMALEANNGRSTGEKPNPFALSAHPVADADVAEGAKWKDIAELRKARIAEDDKLHQRLFNIVETLGLFGEQERGKTYDAATALDRIEMALWGDKPVTKPAAELEAMLGADNKNPTKA
ncbi:hypothetical protein [Rhizobium leguminosarum]|uniref:hypothetical protein n=1 Tax=Rhizobium leguminosarum TaxID=384 RepID=UPI0035178BA3